MLFEIAAAVDRSTIDELDDPRVWRDALDRTLKISHANRAELEREPPHRGMSLGW